MYIWWSVNRQYGGEDMFVKNVSEMLYYGLFVP